MKRLFYLMLCVALMAGCSKDDPTEQGITVDFDPEFAKVLEKRGYIPDATRITIEDVKDIDTLDVSGTYDDWRAGKGLTSLKGIEYFESLTDLDCSVNQLISLDVSNNTGLLYLSCSDNQLASLDVSNNTALKSFSCDNNQLTSLDVSNNTGLLYLSCSDNQLTSLYVSQNIVLQNLWCSDNHLASLDVSKNTALIWLDCSDNHLASLDVSKNTALIWLDCSLNQLTSLDVSRNTALTELDCSWNHLTSLDVSRNVALEQLICYYNPGDGESLFPVTAWFDNDNIPGNMTFRNSWEETDGKSWKYSGKTIRIDFRKAE